MSSFKPSVYNTAITNHVLNSNKNLIVQAAPGAGKSTQCEHSILAVLSKNPFAKILMLAFNKEIVAELKKRLPECVDTYTFHGKGLSMVPKPSRFWRFHAKSTQYKLDKAFKSCPDTFIEPGMEGGLFRERMEVINGICQLLGAVKNYMVDGNDIEALKEWAKEFDKDIPSHAYTLFSKFLKEDIRLSQSGQIDYDDMVYIPVIAKPRNTNIYDYVFVDEAQDMNNSRREFIKLVVKPTGKVVFVGDESQSIYAFCGANSDSMNVIRSEFNCESLPLSITYRCPKSHVTFAKAYTKNPLEAADNAKNGSIETINSDDFVNEVTTTETLVLSRVTSPLISYALRCMNAGKKSIIKGMDIGEKLASIVRKFEVTTIPEVYDRLDIWVENATKRLQVQYKSADHIEDMKDCILVLLESCATLEEYYKKIEAMFSDKETTGILFSTIHKAKGLEAENVYILQPEKIPLVRKDQSPTDIQQEQNCALVAYTRSKNRMVFVKDTTKPKKNKKTETDTDNDNE